MGPLSLTARVLFGSFSICLLTQVETAAAITCDNGPQNIESGDKIYSPTLTRLPDVPFLKYTNSSGQFCSQCPGEPTQGNANKTNITAGFKGYTGVLCETPFEVCPNGDLVCYNGGKCVGQEIPYKITEANNFTYYYYYNDTSVNNNNTKWVCDCRPENLEDQSFTDYAGVACEYPATSQCGDQNLNRLTDDGVADVNDGTWFCTNGGTCNAKQSDVDKKCTCPRGYFGPHCEYHEETANNTDDYYYFIPEVDEVCDLECKNGGQCLFGVKDYSDAFNGDLQKYLGTNLNGMNCACPRGWTGLLCEIPMMVCGGKGPATSVCLNGGICTPSRTSASDFYCDCSNVNPLGNHSKWNASKWNSSREWSDRMRHHGNWSFGGRSCQVPASTLCPVPVNEPNPLGFYCANGGTCPPISAYSTGYCTCPTGFTGPRCEYSDKSPMERNCTLGCQNDGKCFFGTKDYNAWENMASIGFSQGNNVNGMYCQCPPGYAGLLCDSAVELCSAREQFACFNKATCFKNNGVSACNCTAASDGFNKQFAGSRCQFPASSWCQGKFNRPTAFCTNGGTCKSSMDYSNWFPGCNCLPGFVGDRCEIVVQAAVSSVGASSPTLPPVSPPSSNNSLRGSSYKPGTLLIFAVVLGIMLGVFVLYRRRRGRQQQRVAHPANTLQDLNLASVPRMPSPSGASSSAVFTTNSKSAASRSTEAHRDGDEMKEVEIL